MDKIDWTPLMPDVAAIVWGGVKERRSKTDWRYGEGRSVNPVKGLWSDYTKADGAGKPLSGGVLAFLQHQLGLKGPEAFDWLRKHQLINGADMPTPRRDGDGAKERFEKQGRIVKVWPYHNADGSLAYEVCRKETGEVDPKTGKLKKTFLQRTPLGRGEYEWKLMPGQKRLLYKLPEIIEQVAQGRIVFIVEGEKCADVIDEMGGPATTVSGGASKWDPEFHASFFKGAKVVCIPDNDDAGRKHMGEVADSLKGVAESVKVLELPGLANKEDVVEWAQRGGDIGKLYELAATAPERGTEPFVSALGAIPFWELENPGPEHEWLVQGMMTRGEVALIAGESGAAKSFIAIDMAMAIARGQPFFGRRTEQGLVLYNAGEGGLGMKNRLRAYRVANGMHPTSPTPFILLPKPINLFRGDEDAEMLIKEARHWMAVCPGDPLQAIIIDTFSVSTAGGDENSAKDMGPVLERGKRIADTLGTTVIFIQHMNAGGEKVRGWTGIKANVDSVVICRAGEQKDDEDRPVFEMEIDKVKDGVRGLKWRYVLQEVELGENRFGDRVWSAVVALPAGDREIPFTGEIAKWPSRKRDVYQTLRWVLRERGQPPRNGDIPKAITTTVTTTELLDAFCTRIMLMDAEKESEIERRKKRDAAKQAIGRNLSQLQEDGYVGRLINEVWVTGKDPNRPRAKEKDKRAIATPDLPHEPKPLPKDIDDFV